MNQDPLHRREYGYLEEKPLPEEKNGANDQPPFSVRHIPKKQSKPISIGIFGVIGKGIVLLLTSTAQFLGWLFSILARGISLFLFLISKKMGFNKNKHGDSRVYDRGRARRHGLLFTLFSAYRGTLLRTTLYCVIFGSIALVLYTAYISKDLPDPNRLSERRISESTKIYDRTGKYLLYEIFDDQKRTIIPLDKVPNHLKQGLIATEDTKFYEHFGIRPLSILRAFIYGTFTSKRIAGTSTLTQQLVKNAILTNERSLSRKIKEAILSIRLEQKYTKDEILQIYFNEIPYGSTNYGVQAAAQSYFGKNAWELNLQESATLAGMPKAPSTYLNNPEMLRDRRNFVLRRMYEEGYITREEKDAAQNEPMTLSRTYGDIKAPHFVLYVKELLVREFGEHMVDSGGLKVITTLDYDKQTIAEGVIASHSEELLKNAKANNAALLSLDPKNGHILAMVGSRDFFDKEIQGQFNVTTQGKRQPGSSFKPIVYAAAFEKGYTPDTILFDVQTNFAVPPAAPYIPLNYDLGERGPLSMRKALQGSLNIPAVQTLYLVGLDRATAFSERMGYTTLSKGNFGLSLVLGGGEVKMIEHAAAYGAFANNGVLHKTVSILRVENAKGEVLEEWKESKGTEVVSKEVAAQITNVLSDDSARAYIFGAGGVLTLKDRPVAAKTGTTNNYVDAWTVGYTPNIVASVWAGNTNNTPMVQGYGGNKVAGQIWHDYMELAVSTTPAEAFPAFPANSSTKAILRGSLEGGVTLRVNKVTNKIASSSTPESLIVERTYVPPHTILHYVDKDNPNGPQPENPENDPQYSVWENALAEWVKRQQEKDPNFSMTFEEPPTEIDNFDPALAPQITIISPAPSSTITEKTLFIQTNITAARGVSKVTFRLNKKYIGIVREFPFNLSYDLTGTSKGEHLLTVTAEDETGNASVIQQTFTFSPQ